MNIDSLKKTINNYNFIEQLDEGFHATIYKVSEKKEPQKQLALKLIKTGATSEQQQRYFEQRLEHLKILRDVPGVIIPLCFTVKGALAYFLQDYFDGIALDKWADAQKQIPINIFLNIACTLAEGLKYIHEKGIIHGGIKPHNILINTNTSEIKIIDLITPLNVREISHFVYSLDFIKGTLAYTSPEQTGRINHRVDFPSDLYSLGIVLYQLLGKQLPFFSIDPLELIHSHLAQEPSPLTIVNPKIPVMLSRIIEKLMAKQPEKRYQTAAGLLSDLERIRAENETSLKIIKIFQLGTHDRSHRITFISKMVGRDRESRTILDEYKIAANGAFRSLLISGLSGIGKTRLIQELQKPIVEHRGYFSSGKFDVYQKNIPYSSLIQAFRNLIRFFLTESDQRVNFWKEKILKNVGKNGRVIVEVIPELQTLIGPQPEVSSLPPVEARNRFNDVFSNFLTCLASAEHPLVLFIDDLQWCDSASFEFIGNIFATAKDHPYFLLIGAYRNNEVDTAHPLTKLIQNIKVQKNPLKEIHLGPLKKESCHEMVSYILETSPNQTEILADFVAELTEGNPLFVCEMLSYLYNEDLLLMDKNSEWVWDINKIRQSDMPATVVALFSSKVKKLPPKTIELLEYCACMGNQFSPADLAFVNGISLLTVFETLQSALGQGLIIENKEFHQFVHDRVQEAVLLSIAPEKLKSIHAEIGHHYLSRIKPDEPLEKVDNLFTIAAHLNIGSKGDLSPETAFQLSDINYHAGNKSLKSLATEAANKYFRQSLDLLPPDSWETWYDRTFKIYQKLANTELMNGQYEISKGLIEQLLGHARTDLDRAEALAEQTTSLSSIGNFINAIEIANTGLAFFEKAIPRDAALAEEKRNELMNIINAEYGKTIWEKIFNMPFTTARKSKIELAFYSELIPDLYMSGMVPQLYLAAVQSTLHCLEGGMDESVIYSFSIMGLYLGEQGQFEEAFLYEDLAHNLSEKYPNTFGATRGMNGVIWCNMHTRSHPETIANYCLKTIQSGKNCGDLYNAGLAFGPLMWNLQVQGNNFKAIEDYAEECLQFSQKYHLYFSVALAEAMRVGWIEPMKNNYVPTPMQEKITSWEQANYMAAAGSYYVQIAIASYYLGDYEAAEKYLEEVKKYLAGLTDNILKREWTIFRVLNAIKQYENKMTYKTREQLDSYVKPIITMLETWGQFGPMLAPYIALINAELERATGDNKKAKRLYFEAIQVAEESQFTFLQAHINQCLGELFHKEKRETAKAYLNEAARLYRLCNAGRKLTLLIEKYHRYFEEKSTATLIAEPVEKYPEIFPVLDIDYLMKSSLAISEEIDPDILLKKIMNVVLEASGAEHGYLLDEEDNHLIVRAESHITKKDYTENVKYNLESATGICKSIIRYVYRTRGIIVLHNALEEGLFKDNPEVQNLQLHSVLCLPLIKQARLIGILYLENNLANRVFTQEKTKMTELLASQAAISLINARLMDDMKNAREEIRKFNRELEDRVMSRTAELNAANKELESFSYTIAHDLRTPLRSIAGFSQILQSDYGEVLDPKGREYFERIHRAVIRMAQLLDDLLKLAHISQLMIKKEKINLSKIAEKVAEKLSTLHPDRTIELKIEPDILATGDQDLLELTLQNLLDNAYKFTEKSSPAKIEFGTMQIKNRPVYFVRDNGIGFDMTYYNKLFKPFNRLHGIEEYSGTGIGLAIAHRIIKRHGGDLWGEGEENKGATFYFTLQADLTE